MNNLNEGHIYESVNEQARMRRVNNLLAESYEKYEKVLEEKERDERAARITAIEIMSKCGVYIDSKICSFDD